jgi:hypothetical protein
MLAACILTILLLEYFLAHQLLYIERTTRVLPVVCQKMAEYIQFVATYTIKQRKKDRDRHKPGYPRKNNALKMETVGFSKTLLLPVSPHSVTTQIIFAAMITSNLTQCTMLCASP